MTRTSVCEFSTAEVAAWLVAALGGHLPTTQIHSTLVARFGLPEDKARVVRENARDGILLAISGTRKNSPDEAANPIGHACFDLVWSTFNQNSFFDKRSTPTRKWLDWKEQQSLEETA